MDFERVLGALLSEFDRCHIRYAAIGGFALGILGAPRGTQDVDFLVHRDDLNQLHEVMTRLGYQRSAATENASHYVHADRAWGAVDSLHAFRKYALGALERAKSYPIFGGRTQIFVAIPEDLIGFKVQAMANNPMRRMKELVDIETLMELYGSRLDWGSVQEYFDLFDLHQEGQQLKLKFSHAE